MDIQKYIKTHLTQPVLSNKSRSNSIIALIGLGPHAKRIYLNYFKKYKINLALVVDLNSKKNEIEEYLKDNDLIDTKVYTIPDAIKDNEHMPQRITIELLEICKGLKINTIIIATEPKAHNMYIEFALKNNFDVMTDKPITVANNMLNIKNINKVRKQYYNILKMAKKSQSKCNVMCQRQYHKGYEYVKKVLNDTVSKYQIPITYIDIYHCDGNWEMPHDMAKENHPYKYGYGKLFHSGYHFIDLLSDLLKINNQLKDTKKIVNGEVYSNCFTPNDEINIFNIQDYKRIFSNQNIPTYYSINKNPEFEGFGEKNFYGMMKFSNIYNQTITNVNLNLLHYGFSRRGWIETKDFYKENGRIRHESVNIQVGPLLNIQIHSYQSKEIKDRTTSDIEEQVGGLEHFDIDIYRNSDIIGGKPFERIKLGDLYTSKEKKDFLGYNELSREIYLDKFLNRKCNKGNIEDQALAIEILYSCAMSAYNNYCGIEKVQKIITRNNYTYPFKLASLKDYVFKEEKYGLKEAINNYSIITDKYEYTVMENTLKGSKSYEVYLCISDNNLAVSGLLYRKTVSKFLANVYFEVLKYIIKKLDFEKIYKLCTLKKYINRTSNDE